MSVEQDIAAFDDRLTRLESTVADLERRASDNYKLEKAVDYIEKSVDLCVNALKEIARTHCPVHVVNDIDCGIRELRKHRTDPAPPLEVQDPFPASADTPEPKWRKP